MVDSHTCIENELGVKPLLSGTNISNLELTRNTTDEFEITQMFFIANSTIWINLNYQLLEHTTVLSFLFPLPVVYNCQLPSIQTVHSKG